MRRKGAFPTPPPTLCRPPRRPPTLRRIPRSYVLPQPEPGHGQPRRGQFTRRAWQGRRRPGCSGFLEEDGIPAEFADRETTPRPACLGVDKAMRAGAGVPVFLTLPRRASGCPRRMTGRSPPSKSFHTRAPHLPFFGP